MLHWQTTHLICVNRICRGIIVIEPTYDPRNISKLSKRSRVDQVGSLLRPQTLKDAYARHGNGEIGDERIDTDPR